MVPRLFPEYRDMRWKNTAAGYGLLSVALHWVMLLLIVAVYAMMELKSIFPKGSAGRGAMATLHYTLGLSVFVLVWLRLLMRSLGAAPVVEPAPVAWQTRLARVVHWALYGLMIALPVLGWLTVSAKGDPIPFFGAELPPLIAESKAAAKALKKIHETLATAGYFLIGLHAAAALFHHYVLRDNTLKLMWFKRAYSGQGPETGD
jgi:superoxide oxidase